MPTFQNPSGACYTEPVREQVARILDEAGVPLLEDEPYRELAYDPCDRTPLCARLRRTSWIYQGTFSKCLAPGVRVGYLISSPDLHPHLVRLKQAADLHTNRIGQWLAYRSLVAPDRARRMDGVRALYTGKRDAMHAALERHLGELATWERPAGGLFFWARLREPVDTRPLLPEMLARGVAFMPGEAFFPGPEPVTGHIRLNFSHATPQQMDQGLRILAEGLSRH